jgi:hypothetical protein
MTISPLAFEPLIAELTRRPLLINNNRKNSGRGRSQTFGVVKKRRSPNDYSRHCRDRPYLYKLLMDFSANLHGFKYNSITLNQNYCCAPHRDKNNHGESVVIAFGDYTGGELVIESGKHAGENNIRHNAICEDFSLHTHWVRPFKGNRYSVVFYNCSAPDLPPPSVKNIDNEWIFCRGDVLVPQLKIVNKKNNKIIKK